MKSRVTKIIILSLLASLSLLGQEVVWQKTEANDRLRVLDFALNNEGAVFACTDSGIYKSSTNGVSWNLYGLDTLYIKSLAVDSAGRVFAGGGEEYGDKGIYRSTDNGVSWELTISTTEWYTNSRLIRDVNALLTLPGNIILAGVNGLGILRSADYGEAWDTIGSNKINEYIFSLCNSDSGIVYAGTKDGVYRSTDWGLTWVHKPPVRDFTYAVISGNENEVFAGVSYIDGESGVYRSTNRGDSWQKYGLQNLAVTSLSLDEQGGLLAVGAGNGHLYLYRRFGVNNSWELISNNLPSDDGYCVKALPDSHALVGLWSGGIYRSEEVITSVDESLVIPNTMHIINYPNPFNPSTRIKYSLANQGKAKLSIFDVLGCEIEILVDEVISGGDYEIIWDASKFPSGIYFAYLSDGKTYQVSKLVLLK